MLGPKMNLFLMSDNTKCQSGCEKSEYLIHIIDFISSDNIKNEDKDLFRL
jgi:hypothetical protein